MSAAAQTGAGGMGLDCCQAELAERRSAEEIVKVLRDLARHKIFTIETTDYTENTSVFSMT